MLKIPVSKKKIHFVGIGGIGMSGIAEMCCKLGHKVSGSDIGENQNIHRLRGLGIKITIGHSSKNISKDNVYVVVYSSAVPMSNCELKKAKREKIPIIPRSSLLTELMNQRLNITVCGSHGKSSTTAIIGSILDHNNYDPTIINGGIINKYNSTIRYGEGDFNVVEADESDGSFLNLPIYVNVVTNIDAEHLDYYKTEEKLFLAFRKFVVKAPFYGCSVLCVDDESIRKIIDTITSTKYLTYGIDHDADVMAKNISITKEGSYFDVVVKNQSSQNAKSSGEAGSKEVKVYQKVFSALIGRHNILNCLASITVCRYLGLNMDEIISSLKHLSPVKRRFTKVGYAFGAELIDDYGHHPNEIINVLATGKSICSGQVHAVFQPHRYSRLKYLFNDFVNCFNSADKVYILDVYAASEKFDTVYNHNLLYSEMEKKFGDKIISCFGDKPNIVETLHQNVKEGDIVIFLGAGSITYLANDFENLSKQFLSANSKSSLPVKH